MVEVKAKTSVEVEAMVKVEEDADGFSVRTESVCGGGGGMGMTGGGCEEKIFVSVRLRPLNEKEIARNDVCDWECINEVTIIFKNCNLPLPDCSMYSTAYTFDRVFRSDCSTKEVHEKEAKDVALSIVSGINSTFFAYGQTSSGKTFTMMGITEYAVADICYYIEKHNEREFLLKFSAMEIYNESIRDLLSTDSTPLRLLDDPEVQDLLQLVGDEEHSMTRVGFNNYPHLQVRKSPECENPVPDTSPLASPHSLDIGIRLVNRYLYSYGHSGRSSNDDYIQILPEFEENFVPNDTSPQLLAEFSGRLEDIRRRLYELNYGADIERLSRKGSQSSIRSVAVIDLEAHRGRTSTDDNFASVNTCIVRMEEKAELQQEKQVADNPVSFITISDFYFKYFCEKLWLNRVYADAKEGIC
ncbi:Kinesin-like protein KIN-7G [Camellia lanceoleosa]|uniref:Kinesin-like protein KIN-7G n=1 Tax=Camellia lanceoleosa TaxID=1840588 RepID=A0ACC0I2Y4_9ERIC|nr:Kinesin-like protein KIN-7G [Camellia lanceoleosa]